MTSSVKDLFDTAAEGYTSSHDSGQNIDYTSMDMGWQNSHTKTPTVTDLFPDKKFQLPNSSSLPSKSVQLSNAEHVDTKGTQAQLDSVSADYKQTDLQANNTFMEALKETSGARIAGQIGKQLMGTGEAGPIQAGMTVLDPTGVVGAVASVLEEVYAASKKLSNAAMNKELEKAASKIRQDSSPAERGLEVAKNPIKMPEGMDGSQVTAKFMKDFMERDIDQDPVMREVATVQAAIDDVEKNNDLIAGYDDRAGDMTQKAIDAAENGNLAAVEKFTNGTFEAQAVVNGEAEQAPLYDATASLYISLENSTSGVPAHADGITASTLKTEALAHVSDAMAPALSNEPNPHELAITPGAMA